MNCWLGFLPSRFISGPNLISLLWENPWSKDRATSGTSCWLQKLAGKRGNRGQQWQEHTNSIQDFAWSPCFTSPTQIITDLQNTKGTSPRLWVGAARHVHCWMWRGCSSTMAWIVGLRWPESENLQHSVKICENVDRSGDKHTISIQLSPRFTSVHLFSPHSLILFVFPHGLSTSRELILHAAWQWFLITGGGVQVFTIVGYKRPEDSTSFYISSTSTSGVTQSWPFGSGTRLWYWAQAGTCFPDEQQKPETPSCSCRKERSGCLLSKSVHIRTLFYCQQKISSSNDGAHLSLD